MRITTICIRSNGLITRYNIVRRITVIEFVYE